MRWFVRSEKISEYRPENPIKGIVDVQDWTAGSRAAVSSFGLDRPLELVGRGDVAA